ncbi:hypothetical protein PDJAM_G00017010 [Pangasius djambal]|uniref:Uncharacterized protein n=1 Tax=Pangasius djambal TaxID=1691987 RepID=A0ACC5YMB0_9TELE|nr:hypothetical protein [Pangasius djambal]
MMWNAQSPPSPPLTLLPQPQHLKRLLSENRWRRGPPDRTIKTHKEAKTVMYLLWELNPGCLASQAWFQSLMCGL